MKYIEAVVMALLHNDARTATKYVSPKEVVKASRIRERGRLPRKGSNVDIRLTIGRPNYLARQFVKRCVKAGEPFPVKKIQLTFVKKA